MSAARLLHVFATFTAAGPQVRTAKLMQAFGDEFDHAVLSMDGRTDARALLPDGFPLRILPPPPRAGSLRTALAMRALVRRADPELVLTYNWGAIDTVVGLRGSRFGALLHHEDGFRPDEAEGQKWRRSTFRRFVLPAAHRVIVISETLRRVALEQWKLSPALVAFVPNGIRADSFAERDGNAALRARLGIPARAVVVGAVGHLRPEKNLARLLAAVAAALPAADLHVLLLGEGPERTRLEELAAGAPLAGRVHFAGYQADPRDHYRAMDVFALSSDTEQMPIALLEAMSCGLPAVSTDVGDVRAVLPKAQRRFVTAFERAATAAPALAEALATLAADAELRAALGAENRAHVRAAFDEERMLAQYHALYRDALAAGRRQRSP